MPSVLDAPERIEYVETHALTPHGLTIERPQPRGIHPGFWCTLVHGITKHLTHRPRASHTPSCSMPRPFEAPMDRFIRAYSSLSILALAIM
jgi:hypothetical protein